MGAGEGSLWIGTCGDPLITRVDAATGEVQATIPMDIPTWLRDRSSVSVGEGSVWALTDGNDPLLVRIDPATNAVVDRFPVAVGSSALQAGFGAVWITNCDEEILLRIDPATGERVATIDVGYYPDALAIGEGSIWVIDQEDGTVSRVDPVDQHQGRGHPGERRGHRRRHRGGGRIGVGARERRAARRDRSGNQRPSSPATDQPRGTARWRPTTARCG